VLQRTIKSSVSFDGVGLHTGAHVRATVRPAAAEFGIWFRRLDAARGLDPMIPAHWSAVDPSERCTRLKNADGVSVSTVEHVMAALAGCGIHNAVIEVEGPELPILDGSAAPFVTAFMARGVRELDAPVRVLRVCAPVEVRSGEAFARLEPAEGFEIAFSIDFPDRAIGRQEKALDMANGAFVRELSDSRTFGRLADVERLRAAGLGLGGSLDNAIVVDGGRILNPDGLRHADEPVRHKMLDALGDLALAGAPLLARYVGHRAGHALTNRLLHRLFAEPAATRIETCPPEQARRLPGMEMSHADIPVSCSA
jgi:UDP-3-O-[3-hydroxymyristoyl] N-acetylglucosamine deacetylase